ncbi:MAG: hypothetical protein M1829_000611 [Trizodia sp. TS-e1964]|nr:MAG: hypothetical protein M1829_000611 [Trizodia sp. TS-e1964]
MLLNNIILSAILAGCTRAQNGYGYTSDSSAAMAMSSSTMQSSMMSASSASSSAMAVSTTGTTPGMVNVHIVKVSNKAGDLKFEPNDLKALTGDMVQFQFYPKNHSVVQSTFDQPCQPIQNNVPSSPGFFSGFMPVSADSQSMLTYTIMINNTNPIWFYCSQGRHCQSGMAGVINAPATNTSRTIAAYQANAVQAPNNVSPSGSGSSGGSASSGMATSTISLSNGTSTSTPALATNANAAGRLSALGALVPASLVAAVLMFAF